MRRSEPWSQYHNDNIEELNAIDNSSVTEVYKISENRDNGVKPTLVQPAWDPGWTRRTRAQTAALKARAQTFREQRRPGRTGAEVFMW